MNLNLPKNFSVGVPAPAKATSYSMIELISLVIVIVLFTWFIVLPKKANLAVDQKQLTQLQDEQNKTDATLAKLKLLVQNLQAHPKEVTNLDEAMPLRGNSLELQILIESFAGSVGATVGSVNLSVKTDSIASGDKALLADPYKANRTLQKISGSADFIGNLNQLLALLKKLENSGRIMDISDLSIGPAADGNLDLKLNLDAYYLAP